MTAGTARPAAEMAIWKFELPVQDHARITMPRDARVLHVAAGVGGRIFLWAVVNPAAEREVRAFEVRGTGHPLGQVSAYIGTVQAGTFVWHVFHAPSARSTS